MLIIRLKVVPTQKLISLSATGGMVLRITLTYVLKT